MTGLRHRTGPGYLELPQASDGLLKSLILLIAGFVAHLVDLKIESEWGLSAEGFHVMKGVVFGLFAAALYYLAFPRVIRFENSVTRIVVKRGTRVLHLVPLLWTYDCDALSLEYVKGRTKEGKHAKSMDFWKICGVRRQRSIWRLLFADLAVFSKRQDATEFMQLARQFTKSVRSDLPASTEKLIQLTSQGG